MDEDEKPRRKPKVMEKPARTPRKGKLKAILKGFFYVFRPMKEEEFSTEVFKIKHSIENPPAESKPEETYTVTNDSCSCPAGTNNVLCKHVEMVQGRYKGNEFLRDEAEDLMEEWLDELRDKGAKTTAVGELAYGDRVKVKRADCLVYSAVQCSSETIMFLEFKGLMLRVTCVPDEHLYRRRLSEARIAWSNKRKLI